VAGEFVDEPGGSDALETLLVLKKGISVAVQGFVEGEQSQSALANALTLIGLDKSIHLFGTKVPRQTQKDMGRGVGGAEELEVRILQELAFPEGSAVPNLMQHSRVPVPTELAAAIALKKEQLGLVVRPEPQGLSSAETMTLFMRHSLQSCMVASFVEAIHMLQRSAIRF